MIKIAQKITWTEPNAQTITRVEINRATTIYGTYAVIDEIDATSDGLPKSLTNTWVTTYTDTAGTRTNWYKIRFYDGTSLLYGDYSEPVTSEELLRLCTVDDVKQTIEVTGRWSDTEIFRMITQTDDLIYIESGTPIQATWSECLNDTSVTPYEINRSYYVGEANIYRVDRVFVGTTTKTELYLDDEYKTSLRNGMVGVYTVASGGVELDVNGQDEIEIEYVPDIYHKLSLYRTCQALLEQVDATSGGLLSKELQVMTKKVEMVETLLMNRVGVQLSSDVRYYNSIYGVNRKFIRQNIDRNKYLVGQGWDN